MIQRPSRVTWFLIVIGAIVGGFIAARGLGIVVGAGVGYVIGTALTRAPRSSVPDVPDVSVVRYIEYDATVPDDPGVPVAADGAREREMLLQRLHGDILLLSHRDLLQSLGAAVQRLRIRKGWSQEELATLTGFEAAYLEDVELGRRDPSVVDVARIAEALDVSFGDLIALSEPLPDDLEPTFERQT